MNSDTRKQSGNGDHGEGEGHLLLNIGKVIFLVVVLVAFWYFFDKWLSSK